MSVRKITMYIVIFLTDITLFYLIPLVLSVVLYTLIAVMLLFTAPRTFNDGTVRNQARLQVSDKKQVCSSSRCSDAASEKYYFILLLVASYYVQIL